MFFPSDKAMDLLANTLFALGNWYEVLQRYGIADEGMQQEWEENMELGMQSDADNVFSWQRLREELNRAREQSPEQLRRLCGELLRDRSALASRTQESNKFLDHVAQLEVRLGEEGSTFNGFSIQTPRAKFLLTERIGSALQSFFESTSKP